MKTPISYYGGKQTLLKHILPLIPPHKLYTESFCGGCAVLFAKRQADCEVINDINKNLINFYTEAKTNYCELKKVIDSTLHSRDQHRHAVYVCSNPTYFTRSEWAWATWTLGKMSFASMQDGSFGYDRSGTTALKIANAKEDFTEQLCRRLESVTIESEDALSVIARYDCPDAFHFVDPPYINSDCGHYEGTFDAADMERLLKLLTQVKGKFMLTMFPLDMIETYAQENGWTIHRIERTISASRDSRRRQEEWIVCNYTDLAQQSLF